MRNALTSKDSCVSRFDLGRGRSGECLRWNGSISFRKESWRGGGRALAPRKENLPPEKRILPRREKLFEKADGRALSGVLQTCVSDLT
ncbi:MAG: hypothetical protein M2R45_05033 [Verrucomicrobia subdivision 3 bacterium]|nr:hypothetical protein [Limisphaerales bacterium]MCS1417640.1 hypothetical protein [Limisphaerales bacterium]